MTEQKLLPFVDEESRFQVTRVEVWAVRDRKTGMVVACQYGATRDDATDKANKKEANIPRNEWSSSFNRMVSSAVYAKDKNQMSDWDRKVISWQHSLVIRAKRSPFERSKGIRLPRRITSTWNECCDRLRKQGNSAVTHSYRLANDPWRDWRHFTMKNSNRRANGNGVNGRVTGKELKHLIEFQQYRCKLSGRQLTPQNASLDHIVPLSAGGSHKLDNLQILEYSVNKAKGTLGQGEFIQMCRDIASISNGQP